MSAGVIGILVLLLAGAVQAAPVNLAWDPVPDARVTGYELGWGSTSGAYTAFQSAPASETNSTLALVDPGPWYIAVRALAVDGGQPIQSAWSNEIIWQAEPSGPTQPLAQTGVWAHYEREGPVAIAYTHLTGGGSTSNPASTASITPTANAQVLIAIGLQISDSFIAGDLGSIAVSGCDLTWTQVAANIVSGQRRGIYLWRGVGASPSTGALTITYTPPAGRTFNGMKWSVDEFTGVDSTTPLGTAATALGFSTAASTSLEAPATGDWAYAAVTTPTNADSSLNSELDTDIYEASDSTAISHLHIGADTAPDSNPAPGFSWASGMAWYQVGVLLKAGAATAASAPPFNPYAIRLAHLLGR